MRRLILISYVFSFFIFYPLHSFSQQGWYQLNSGTTSNLKSVFFTDANNGYAVGYSGTILKTTNGGLNWIIQQSLTSEDLYSVKFIDQTGFVVGGSSIPIILKTTNGGDNWFSLSVAGANRLRSVFMIDSNLIYASGLWGTLLKTTNGGDNWSLSASHTVHFYSIFFVNDSTGYTGGPNSMHAGGGTYKTTNGGSNWSFVSYAGQGNFINFINGSTGFVLSLISLNKTTNGGLSWNGIDPPSGYNYESVSFNDISTGYVVGNSSNSGYIFKTTDAGNNWSQQTIPLSGSLFSIYMINPNTGYTVGNSGTILKTTNGGVTSIVNVSNEIPREFKLHQNYPNPFNPSTIIQFDIARKSGVNLSIYDLSGRKIDELVNEVLDPGMYNFSFDGENYASGVYLYVLQVDNYTFTRKMILLK